MLFLLKEIPFFSINTTSLKFLLFSKFNIEL